MALICPTVTAYSETEYKNQLAKIQHLSRRIQIDLTDGKFTDKATVEPSAAWWPAGIKADFHLMYENPMSAVKLVVKQQPNLVIFHAESKDGFAEIISFCQHHNVKVGMALLPQTEVRGVRKYISQLDHILIFSGNLGYQGGSSADLALLEKVAEIRESSPGIEIGWDGGVDDQNVAELVYGGIDVLNVGGYIQHAQDSQKAYDALQRIADETGET